MTSTVLGRELTLEDAYRYKGRVEITFTGDEWGWPSEGGPLNPVRGYITKNSPKAKWRIYILLRLRSSCGGYQINADHIKSIREVRVAR